MLIYGLVFYKWCIAIFLPIITAIGAVPLLKLIVMPKPDSEFYKNKIVMSLEKKIIHYEFKGDTARAKVAQAVLDKLHNFNKPLMDL